MKSLLQSATAIRPGRYPVHVRIGRRAQGRGFEPLRICLGMWRKLRRASTSAVEDKVFNVLPVFHSFGLTAGLVLPLVSGVPVYLYPSPLHYRFIPELVYGSNATILFGTDTFLTGYARMANAYDFRSTAAMSWRARNRSRAATRALYMEKFGLRILEGYGVTETSPVLALNTPMYSRSGTVGRVLPGIETRLEPVEGVDGWRAPLRARAERHAGLSQGGQTRSPGAGERRLA